MASITIRNLDDNIKAKLRIQAAQHGLSMEQEVREILRESLDKAAIAEGTFLERMRSHFAGLGIDELPIPPRDDKGRPLPDFSDFVTKED